MTPESFSAFLKSPESHTISINHLEQLIEKYPYVQSLRIALLKKLKAENHPDFEKYLGQTATYAYDRTFLRKYINGESIYILEYPTNQIEAEVLETLDLVPLKSLQDFTESEANYEIVEKVEVVEKEVFIANVIENEFVNDEIVEEEIRLEEEIVEDKHSELEVDNVESINTGSEVVELEEETTELIHFENEIVEEEAAEEIKDSENESIETSDNAVVKEEETTELINTDNELKEAAIDADTAITEKPIVEASETEVKEEELTNDSKEPVEELSGNMEEIRSNNENIEDMQEAIIEEKSLEDEIQHLIIDSKKVDYHAPIEENIDHLIDEGELEGLDDEIEFGFEIDKKIIANEEDISIFDTEALEHHTDEDKSGHQEHHGNEEVHGSEEKQEHHEKEVQGDKKDATELSPDNIFSKDDLRQEGSLFFLDDRPTIEEAEIETIENGIPAIDFVNAASDYENEDAEDFPEEFEEKEAEIESRENVEQIKAVLSEKDSKEAKKAKIKEYLKRIAQIPLEQESLISETYAGLLAKQGKIERSIRMYQQLILKNPQKKVYFAAKIKQLIKSI